MESRKAKGLCMNVEQLQSPMFEAFSRCVNQQYIYICDVKSNLWRWSPYAVNYFGLSGEYVQDFPVWWIKRVHPDDVEKVRRVLTAIFSEEVEDHSCEYRVKNAQNEYVWVMCHGSMMHSEDEGAKLCVGIITNLGSKNKFDALTGLYSFHEFHVRMDAILRNRSQRGGALLFGINQFRRINEVYQYSFGNELLSVYAKKLESLLPKGGTLYRMEGDKFALIYPGAGEEQLRDIYQKISDIGESSFAVSCGKIHFTVCGGAVLYPENGIAGDELYTKLEYALEMAKKTKKGSLIFFTSHLQQKSLHAFTLQQRLRESVRGGCKEFSLCYQPIVSQSDKQLVGAEALLRWSAPDYPDVTPLDFISILESSGEIVDVGKWVLSTALAQVKEWQNVQPQMKVYINVSYLQLLDGTFREYVLHELERHQFPAHQLVLELTESCDVSNPEKVKEEFAKFREAGIQIALDDFGTGYASLSILRELPTDWIKVDHQFVSQIVNNEFDKALTGYLVGLCKKLGIQVCVEGIETKEIQNIIETFSPDVLQGYFYSRPIPAEEFNQQFIVTEELQKEQTHGKTDIQEEPY